MTRCGATSPTGAPRQSCPTSFRTVTDAPLPRGTPRRRAGEPPIAGNVPAWRWRTPVVARGQAIRTRAAPPQPGLPARQPRTAQRVVRRRRGVEHRHDRAHADDVPAAARRPRRAAPTGRRCCGCPSSSGSGRSSTRWTCGCPRAPPSCSCTCGSPIPVRPRCRCTGGPTSPCPSVPTCECSRPQTRRGTSTTTEGCAGCRCRTTRVSTGRTRRARATPLTTSSPSTTTSGDGWLPWTPRAAGSSRRRPAVCAAASCSCGARAPVESTGRTGSPAPPVSTSRSRPAWRGPSWSTCRCPGTRRGRGSRRSAARGRNEGGALR